MAVEIERYAGGYRLLRGGEPYEVRGAGIGVDAPNAPAMLRKLKEHGGNSVRTWTVGDGAFLDWAHAEGLTVALCLEIGRERHGFDYGDPAAVRRQFEAARAEVLKHRNHPALLVWIIGNELNLEYRDPRVYDAVNEIAGMIHELDPKHPVTSSTAGIDAELAAVIAARAPALDFLSVQVYGGLFQLPGTLETIGLELPLMITEWGTIGHWEVPTTDWGAPLELSSTAKAATYARGAREIFPQLESRLLGNYVFLWGQKQERTPTWYGLFVDGRRTEAVDELQRYWTGRAPAEPAPQIRSLKLAGQLATDDVRLQVGQSYDAVAVLPHAERRSFEYRWVVLEESEATQTGGDREMVPPSVPGAVVPGLAGRATVRAPERTGAYRLFVYVYDPAGAVAHANLPFFVTAGDAR